MSSSWLKQRRKSNNTKNNINNNTLKRRSASLPRPHKKGGATGLEISAEYNNNDVMEAGTQSDTGTMLRYFNMRNPTNLTGRFPSTVALHAKVEELLDSQQQINNSNQEITQQQQKQQQQLMLTQIANVELQVPNLVQPLSLLPDWR